MTHEFFGFPKKNELAVFFSLLKSFSKMMQYCCDEKSF